MRQFQVLGAIVLVTGVVLVVAGGFSVCDFVVQHEDATSFGWRRQDDVRDSFNRSSDELIQKLSRQEIDAADWQREMDVVMARFITDSQDAAKVRAGQIESVARIRRRTDNLIVTGLIGLIVGAVMFAKGNKGNRRMVSVA